MNYLVYAHREEHLFFEMHFLFVNSELYIIKELCKKVFVENRDNIKRYNFLKNIRDNSI